MISGRRCLVRGRVTEAGEFLELTGEALRTLVARDAELSEIFMRAFILRRLAAGQSRARQSHLDGFASFGRTRFACANFSRATNIRTPTSIWTPTRLRRNCWIVSM